MSFGDVVFYVAVGLPVAWLAWLVVRPFLSRMNRLLFVVFGLVLYGYFVKLIAVPMHDILSAHLTARQSMVEMGYPDYAVESNEGAVTFALYVIPTMAVVLLLLFWLQRVLSRSPKSTPA